MKATSTSKERYGTGLAITRLPGPYEGMGFLWKARGVSTTSAGVLYALEIIQGIPEETSSPAAWADRAGSSKCLSKFGHRIHGWGWVGDKRECWTDSCKNKDPFTLDSAQLSPSFLSP